MVLGNTLNILRPPERSTPAIQTGWNEDLIKNLHSVLGRMSQQVTAAAVSTSVPTSFATKAVLEAATIPIIVTSVTLTGYSADGDGGGGLYKRGSEPSHAFKIQSQDGAWWELVPDSAGIDVRQVGAKGDDTTDDATALNNWLAAGSLSAELKLSPGIYLTGSTLTGTDNPQKLIGGGWQRDGSQAFIGTVLKANGTGVTDLLTLPSTTPTDEGTTNTESLVVKDFVLIHRGNGIGLLVDNVTRSRIENIYIACQDEGAIGLKYDHWGFFSVLNQCVINSFTNTGVLMVGNGSAHSIRDCHISSSNASALYGIDVRTEGPIIQGGQINVNLSGDTGIGIRLHNVAAANSFKKATISDVLFENDVGVEINKAGTSNWDTVEIIRAKSRLSQVKLVVFFGKTNSSVLRDPQIDNFNGGGTLAEWSADAVDCGVVCDKSTATSPLTVHASATRAWMRVRGTVSKSERDNITTDANLTVTVDRVVNIGRNVHNGTAWDKEFLVALTETAVSVTPPEKTGVVEVATHKARGWYILASFDLNSTAVMESLVLGSDSEMDTTDGTLADASGNPGKITIRADSSSGKIYVSNRRGGSLNMLIKFTPVPA